MGTNPDVQDNPLALDAFSPSGSLSGEIRSPLNIPANVSSNVSFQFLCDGQEANGRIARFGAAWYLNWDKSIVPNGVHYLEILARVLGSDGSYINARGPTEPVNVNNAVTFANEIGGWFSDALMINTTIQTPDDFYMLEIYDAATQQHLKTLPEGGGVGTANNGSISEVWNSQN